MLRKYQQEAIDSIFKYFYSKDAGNPLICAPTGSGKSHILAGFCAESHKRFPNEKILILTHTKEIIRQDARILRDYLCPTSVGVYSAGLNSRQFRLFTVASIQSVYKKAHLFQEYGLIIVDEAHLIPPEGEGRYRTFLGKFPKVKVLGLTATPFRRGHGLLTEGHLFDKIIYNIEIQKLIQEGYLALLSTKATEYVLDTKGLKILAGDYSKIDLSRRLDHVHITKRIVEELIKFKESRKSWLVFAIDIEHCEHIAAELNKAGILAAAVHSKLDFDRKHLLDLFTAGHLQAIVSVETLTTGFDAPNVDMIVMMRPTQSPVLHVQMLGRGMRINPGKDKCLVLDFAGNVARLGPVDNVYIKKKGRAKKGEGGNGFTKVCPKCAEIVHIRVKKCPSCNHIFTIQTKLVTQASTEAVLQEKKKVFTKTIRHIRYSKHHKAGKTPSFKVSYTCGLFILYHEWIAFQHKGYPRLKAEQWWKQRAGGECPNTVAEALQRQTELRHPTQIRVGYYDKYPTILGYTF